MLFAALCHDKPGALSIRLATRDTHVAWLKSLGARVRIAGPFLDDAAEIMQGSIVVIEAETLAEAKGIFAADPYAVAGLFETVEIRPWRWTIGAPTA